MRLYFLRHGIAEERRTDLPDAQRQLVPQGKVNTQHLANNLAGYGVAPHLIITSPLARARQTADIVAQTINISLLEDERLGFGFNPRALQRMVDEHGDGQDLMLVGHEPTFSETISYIIGGGNLTMKKGGLARVDLYSEHPLHGSLIWLAPPKLTGQGNVISG